MRRVLQYLSDALAVALVGACVALVVLTPLLGLWGLARTVLAADEPAPHSRVAVVGDVEVYRVGVTTADGRVAECYVTGQGGIDCLEPVEDAW